jgi:hypothetical protein
MDSRIWAKARLRVRGERGPSEEEEDDDDEEDDEEGLLLGLRGFFCAVLGARSWQTGSGVDVRGGPAAGLSSRGAVDMDGDREGSDRGGSASAPSMALTGEQESLLIWRSSSRRGVCGDSGPAAGGESDTCGAEEVPAAGRDSSLCDWRGGVTCLRVLEHPRDGPGVGWRRLLRGSLDMLLRRDLLGDGPQLLEEGVQERALDAGRRSLGLRRGVRERFSVGHRLPMLVAIL